MLIGGDVLEHVGEGHQGYEVVGRFSMEERSSERQMVVNFAVNSCGEYLNCQKRDK